MAALPSQSSSTDLTSTSSSSSDTSEEGESGEMDASTSDDGGLQAPAGAAPGPAPGEGTETGAGVSHPSVRTQPQLPQLYETHKHQQGLSQATGMDMSSAGDVQHHGRKRGRDAVAGEQGDTGAAKHRRTGGPQTRSLMGPMRQQWCMLATAGCAHSIA
jgi:hypothetical protein